MDYQYLGKSGLKVSRLCLGTMNFGTTTEEKDAFRIMDAALDVGINFFDTANVYGEILALQNLLLVDGSNKAEVEERKWY